MSAASDMREKRYEMNAGSRERGGSRANRTPGVVDDAPRLVRTAPEPEHIIQQDEKLMVWLGAIEEIAQLRVKTDFTTAERYAQDMRDGDEFPAVTIIRVREDGKPDRLVLADGYTRVEARRLADFDRVHAVVRDGTIDDAYLANIDENGRHGLQYTTADKRKAAEWLIRRYYLLEQPEMSLREIARRVKASPTSVSGLYKAMVAAVGPLVPPAPTQTRIQRNGEVFWMKTGTINENRPGANARVAPIVEATESANPWRIGDMVTHNGNVIYKVLGVAGENVTIKTAAHVGTDKGMMKTVHHSELTRHAVQPLAPPAPAASARLSEQTDKTDTPDSAPTHVESIIRDRNGVQITLDAHIRTRSGRTGAVVGMSGRAITVREDGVVGTRMHYSETLEVVTAERSEVKVTPPPPAPGPVLAEEIDVVAETMLRIENARITEVPTAPDAGDNPLNTKTLSVRAGEMDMTTFQALAVAMRRGTRITLLVCIHEDEEER